MADNVQIEKLISALSERLGADKAEIRGAVNSGKFDGLLNRLDNRQASKIESILKDEEQAKKFLSTPQAQAIMRKMMS